METQSYFSKGYVQHLMTLVLVVAIAALAAYAYLTLREAQGVYTGEVTITVNGEGEVLAKPDIGQFSFSVQAEGEDAVTAQDSSAEAINTILAYLAEEGVEDKDIKTQNYNLNPKYRFEDRFCPGGGFCPPGERVIDGYEVSQTVIVKVRNLENAGALISGAGERGATNISSLDFTIDETDELAAEAREEAIADAKAKAEKLAENLGMKIEKIVGFYENEGGYYPMMERAAYAQDSAGGFGGETFNAPSLPVGENTVRSNVSITYQLR